MKNLKQLFTALFLCLAFTTTASADNYDEATMGKKVVELNTVPWGQSSPYNNLCWTSDAQTTHAKTGCGPTAFAILCNYYNWPESGTGTVEPTDYNNVFAPITLGHEYDYANMREDNYPTGYSGDEATAVATLMRDLGYALKVTYGSSGTGFSENNVGNLVTNFNYTSKCYSSIYSNFYKITKDDNYDGIDEAAYIQHIKDCLDLGYPVPYSTATTGGRHIFILDGYTENGYYHFNFGWNGQGNGWYALSDIKPDEDSDYTEDQAAYVYFIPNKTKYSVTATVNDSNAGTVAITSVEAGSSANASFIEGSTPKLTATANDGYTFSHWSKGGVQVSQENTIKLDPLTSAVEYVANFLTPSATQKVNVTVNVPNSSYGTVTYESSNVASGTVLTPFLNSAITLVAAANDNDYVFSSWTVTVGTESTNYYNETLTIAATSDMTITANFSLAQQTHTIDVENVTIEEADKYNSWCSKWTYNGIEIHSTIGGTDAYALSKLYMRIYANALTSANKVTPSNPVVFTLTAPENYTIIDYSFDCKSSSSTYTVDVTKEGDAQATNVNNSTTTTISPDADINKKSTYFTLTPTSTGQQSLAVSNFTVTIKKDGAGSSEPVTPVTYNISVSASPGTSGIAYIGNGTTYSKNVTVGQSVTLTAEALSGYTFTGWYLNDVLKSNSLEYEFYPTASGEYVAKFAQQQAATYTITATANNAEYGTVTGGGAYTSGASVTLTATPNSGYRFVNWTNDLNTDVVTDNPCTVTVNSAATYTANFEPEPQVESYTVTVTSNIPATVGKGVYMNSGASQKVTSLEVTNGTEVELKATPDNADVSTEGYVFDSWRVNGEVVSNEVLFNISEFTKDVEYEAYFVEGRRVSFSCNYVFGYINMFDSIDTQLSPGTNGVLIKLNDNVKLQAVPNNAYRFVDWVDANNSNAFVSNDNPYVFSVTENMTLFANFEPVNYVLTVSVNNAEYGSVTVESGGNESTESVKVGYSMTATITATPETGYRFLYWKKGDEIVSSQAEYTIPAIDDVDAMVDVEYVAIFEEATVESGAYYRIAHKFTVANAVATVAAGETQQYEISPTTGEHENGDPLENATLFSTWFNKTRDNYPASLTLTATKANGEPVDNINLTKGGFISLRGYCDKNNPTTTYTIAVPEDYKITGYEIHFEVWSGVSVTYNNGSTTTGSLSSGTVTSISESELDVYSVSFDVTKTGTETSAGMDLTSFIVYIQQEGGETPETPEPIKYYVQSEPSNVTGKANSLLMNENTNKESIFYYSETGNKLISYSTGKYIKEDGNARGLQDYGVENAGTVTIETTGENSTIATPYLMHASSVELGTGGTVYFVDNCNVATCSHDHNFILEEVDTLPVTISSVGYATFYAPVAVSLPDDVKAHTIEIAGDYAMLSEGFTEVPANTGVILTGTPADYEFTIIDAADERESILKGTVAAEYVYEEAYVLLNDAEDGLGLYKAALNKKDGNAFLNYSHKAYLPKSALTPAAAMSTGFRFRFATTTAIEEVEGADVDAIYDLQGRKLEGTLGAGFYIINGKKVFVK